MHSIRETPYYRETALLKKSTDNTQGRLRAILSRLDDFISPSTRITQSSNYPGLYLLENPHLKLNRKLLIHVNYNLQDYPCP